MLADTYFPSDPSEFLFQTGAIRSYFGAGFIAGAIVFLFQTGAIRSETMITSESSMETRFYSKLVRLEGDFLLFAFGSGFVVFLFQTGAIRSQEEDISH